MARSTSPILETEGSACEGNADAPSQVVHETRRHGISLAVIETQKDCNSEQSGICSVLKLLNPYAPRVLTAILPLNRPQ